ncbi:MAG: hypothetical protein LBL86_01210 [Coriobacteriales bacterium]|jgi:hypothetical protein|nr:hypothetical protein [Coriobacteriales bacterium]
MTDLYASIGQQLEPFAAHMAGNPLASLVAVKGMPGRAERDGGTPFSGEDGFALDKAFGRLGWGFGSQDTRVWLGILLPPASEESPRGGRSALDLRLVCEIVDPLAIVALDEPARIALIDAFGPSEGSLPTELAPGAEAQALGRRLVSVEDFEASLADEAAKQKAWAQLKRCTFPQ